MNSCPGFEFSHHGLAPAPAPASAGWPWPRVGPGSEVSGLALSCVAWLCGAWHCSLLARAPSFRVSLPQVRPAAPGIRQLQRGIARRSGSVSRPRGVAVASTATEQQAGGAVAGGDLFANYTVTKAALFPGQVRPPHAPTAAPFSLRAQPLPARLAWSRLWQSV